MGQRIRSLPFSRCNGREHASRWCDLTGPLAGSLTKPAPAMVADPVSSVRRVERIDTAVVFFCTVGTEKGKHGPVRNGERQAAQGAYWWSHRQIDNFLSTPQVGLTAIFALV